MSTDVTAALAAEPRSHRSAVVMIPVATAPSGPVAPHAENLTKALEEYELQPYFALWQFPEGRHAYSVDEVGLGYLILCDSQEAGETYLLEDAAMNLRPQSLYRLDQLTLPEAMQLVRELPLPQQLSTGGYLQSVGGIVLRHLSGAWTRYGRLIPL